MERFLKQYTKENMKVAMLQHEETFREQVNELHRLYRVQKLLMGDMKRPTEPRRQRKFACSDSALELWNASCNGYNNRSRPRPTLDLERPAEEYIDENGEDVMVENEEESNVELTLAIGGCRRRKEDGSVTSESGTSLSSSSNDSGGENLKLYEWGVFEVSRTLQKSGFDAEEATRRNALKQPSWRLQCLSANIRG